MTTTQFLLLIGVIYLSHETTTTFRYINGIFALTFASAIGLSLI
jgi:hypothetical protein